MDKWEEIVGQTNLTEEDKQRNKIARAHSFIERVSPETIERVYGILHSEYMEKGKPGHKGRQKVMRRIRETGFPLEPYSNMDSRELISYMSGVIREVDFYKEVLEKKYDSEEIEDTKEARVFKQGDLELITEKDEEKVQFELDL